MGRRLLQATIAGLVIISAGCSHSYRGFDFEQAEARKTVRETAAAQLKQAEPRTTRQDAFGEFIRAVYDQDDGSDTGSQAGDRENEGNTSKLALSVSEKLGGHLSSMSSREWLWSKHNAGRPDRCFNALKIEGCKHDTDPHWKEIGERNRNRLNAMYGHERRRIADARGDDAAFVGLALSGGGIRSASFATGVMQGLHELGYLDHVGYISSVSGGGYAAAWYLTHVGEKAQRGETMTPDMLFSPGSEHLQHLNQFGNYLVSTNYSRRMSGAVWSFVRHGAGMPFHWLLNGMFDFDLNVFGLRDTYREGIIRGFLYDDPFSEKTRNDINVPIRDLAPSEDRPFWICNMHLALNEDRGYHKGRSGDAFEVTPVWAGADAVGYVELGEGTPGNDSDSSESWTGVARVAAASGAAVDSQSLKMGKLASAATQLCNFDLGYFIPGFCYRYDKSSKWRGYLPCTGYFLSSFFLINWLPWPDCGANLTGRDGHAKTAAAYKLRVTDGGHFDNLGAYALVRRGCRVIIISDATQDEGVLEWDQSRNSRRADCFGDLRELETKLRADFGAEVQMDWQSFRVAETYDSRKRFGGFPSGTVFLGKISNLPIANLAEKTKWHDKDVTIVYIKAAYSADDTLLNRSTHVDAEKNASPSFPHLTTANQFYGERTVLAYRAVGREAVLSAKGRLKRIFGPEDEQRSSTAGKGTANPNQSGDGGKQTATH